MICVMGWMMRKEDIIMSVVEENGEQVEIGYGKVKSLVLISENLLNNSYIF